MTRSRELSAEVRARLVTVAAAAVRFRFSITPPAFVELVAARASHVAEAALPDHTRRLSLDDLYLACACSGGDDNAWRECEARYFDYIRGFARRFLDDAAAADVADQIIADLWRRELLTMYDGRSSLKTWLGAVVSNAAANAGKARRRIVPLGRRASGQQRASRPERPAAAPEAEAEERAFADLVQRALRGLKADQKLLLLMYYEQGLTLQEMERVLGASKATLSRRLQQARQDVRQAIDELAQRELRLEPQALRERIDLSRLEMDLVAALGVVKRRGRVVV